MRQVGIEGAYKELAIAIVEQACDDYISILNSKWRYLNKGNMEKYREFESKQHDIEHYFGSEDYYLFTNLDGDVMRLGCYRKAFLKYRKTQDSKKLKKHIKQLAA